jgi:hypothetical protein
MLGSVRVFLESIGLFSFLDPVWLVVLSPVSYRVLDRHEVENVRNREVKGVKRERFSQKKLQKKRIHGKNNSLLFCCQGWSSTTCGLQTLGLQASGFQYRKWGRERERSSGRVLVQGN